MKGLHIDNPKRWEEAWKEELAFFYTELKRLHVGSKKRPLEFVELFEKVEKRLPHFKNSGSESIEKERTYVEKLIERLRPDYLASLCRADKQAENRKFWNKIYCPRVRFLEGGRADGNR